MTITGIQGLYDDKPCAELPRCKTAGRLHAYNIELIAY
jgi:hypothetical protein